VNGAHSGSPPRPQAPAYRRAGVDLEEGERAVRRLGRWARETRTPRVVGGIGAFAGFFAYPEPDSERLLVSSMDGVGTKLKLAAQLGRWKGVGYDIVAHCVNDILVHGARPLFFLDYIAAGSLSAAVVEELVEGMSAACRESGCALIGGETAEMPGVYAAGEGDVVGTIVGEVDRSELIDGRGIEAGDRILGLPSAGLHTNGFSLARRLLGSDADPAILREKPAGSSLSWADLLLETHRLYLPQLGPLLSPPRVRGLSHVTGGGLPGNLPRILPEGTRAVVRRDAWPVPPVFGHLLARAEIDLDERYRVFNMGIGMAIVVGAAESEGVRRTLEEGGAAPLEIGWVERGERALRWARPGESGPA
jgi:phosphoribosylformylglycinamidine cyclo-ligase